MKKIDIGKNVTDIGKFAFRKDNRPYETAAITEVINRSVKPQTINKYHFFNTDLSKVVLRVPKQSLEDYRLAEGWKEFGTITALDEIKYPVQAVCSQNEKEPAATSDFIHTVHIWIGNFENKKELEEYADNSEYEWEYYGHLLGEDNFDEPPEEYGIGCGFCWDNNLKYKDAADITDDLVWQFSKKEKPVSDIIFELPVDHDEVLKTCSKKYPALKNANSWIVVFGWPNKKKDFRKAKPDKPCFYLGEFEIPD